MAVPSALARTPARLEREAQRASRRSCRRRSASPPGLHTTARATGSDLPLSAKELVPWAWR
eukprot:2657309-Lingulodinium_polyedra.AAC.1